MFCERYEMGEQITFVSSSLNISDGPSASIDAEFESSALVSFSSSNYQTNIVFKGIRVIMLLTGFQIDLQASEPF